MAKKGWVASEERRSFWRAAIELQHQSGRSVRQFCQQEGLSLPSFYAWRRRLPMAEHGGPKAADTAAKFVPVHVADGSSPLVIELAGGTTLRVSESCSPQLLRKALESLRC
jgi:hypothetical protein